MDPQFPQSQPQSPQPVYQPVPPVPPVPTVHPEQQHSAYHQPHPVEPAMLQPQPGTGLVPMPVVQVLSPRGVEYVFMIIALFTGAAGLTSALIALVNGKTSFGALAFPAALLLVGLPIFAGLFLRQKKAEQRNPALALDASKRRSTQATQIICFLIVLFSLVGLVSAVFAKLGGQLDSSFIKIILDVIVLLVIFGGILFYYWRDEHKAS